MCLNDAVPALRHSRDRKHAPYPDTGAGIHALTFRERVSTAIPPPTSTRRPHFVFPAKAHPEPGTAPESSGVWVVPIFIPWYENDVTRRRVCLNDAAPALVVPNPQFVIPAKAGIHALTFRERTSTAIPPPTSTRRPHFVFPAKAHPEPRYGAGIQRGVGGANFHTLVCRPQPA